MAMFGRKRFDPFAGPEVYNTPGFGDGIPQGYSGGQLPPGVGGDLGAAAMPYETSPDMAQMPQVDTPNVKPGFFGKGGAWRDTLGEGLGAIAQQFGGSNPYEQDRDRQHEMALLRLRGEIDSDQQQAINLGDGGVGTWSRKGGFQTVREPTPADKRTTAMQNWEYRNGLPEGQRGEFDRTQPGYIYTPGGIAAQTELATNKAKATAQYRAPPKAGAPRYEYRTGPSGQVQRKRVN
jgi:hypothetical protein